MDDTALRRALDAGGIAFAEVDAEGRITSGSPAFARTLVAGGETHGLHLVSACPDRNQPEVMAALVRVLEGVSEVERCELRLADGNGDARIVVLTLASADDHVIAVANDATVTHRAERRRRREAVELVRAATEDPVTGLANHRALDSLLRSAVRRSARTGCPLSLMCVEIGGLSALLDSLVPRQADELMQHCADRLSERLRPSDQVTRGDGNIFWVLAEDLGDEQDAAGVAYRLLSSVVEPFDVAEHPVTLAMTIGVVVADENAVADRLVPSATQSLADARNDGSGTFHLLDLRPGLAA